MYNWNETKSKIVMAKVACNKRKVFSPENWVQFMEETMEVLRLEHSLTSCWNLDTSESIWEVAGEIWNVVLKKDRKDQLDR